LPKAAVTDVSGNVLRRAGPEDLEDLVWLAREFSVEQHAFDLDRVLAALRPLLADDSLGQVWLVENPEHPGERAGYAVITWGWSLACGGRQGVIDEMHVRAHGNTLATRALAELLEVAQAAGAARVFVETEAHDRHAREFYGLADFDLTDSVWMNVSLAPPGSGADASPRS
jgi:GNAT superfamily N-acetyltransferase